ncbi:MAG TPA: PEGA domain-containing protein [Polyangia bacterium]|nr:PEGA domain-containing protein [Polyangia bacterium]
MIRALAAAVVILACAAPAPAQVDDKARAEAERLTAQGARAYGRGDFPTALEHFRRSYEIFPSPNTHSNIARALLKLGRLPEAMEEFEAFLADATGAGDDARRFALEQKVQLAAQLGKLEIVADVDGAEVQLDARIVGRTPLALDRWVMPGAHTVTVSAPAYAPFSTRVQLGAGELRTVHARLKDAQAHNADAPNLPPNAPASNVPPPPETPPPPAETGPPPPEHTGRWMANLKLGFSPILYVTNGNGSNPIYFSFAAEIGVAVCCRNRLYVVFPFSLHYKDFGFGATITFLELPLGLQYDVHLIAALYLPIGLSVGYAVAIPTGLTNNDAVHGGVVRPQVGVKYVIKGRGNVGVDAFNLPILFNGNGVTLEYRMMFYGGVNF